MEKNFNSKEKFFHRIIRPIKRQGTQILMIVMVYHDFWFKLICHFLWFVTSFTSHSQGLIRKNHKYQSKSWQSWKSAFPLFRAHSCSHQKNLKNSTLWYSSVPWEASIPKRTFLRDGKPMRIPDNSYNWISFNNSWPQPIL